MAALRNNGTAELFVNLATHELREYFTLPRMVDHVLRRVEQPFIKKCLLMRVGAHLVDGNTLTAAHAVRAGGRRMRAQVTRPR